MPVPLWTDLSFESAVDRLPIGERPKPLKSHKLPLTYLPKYRHFLGILALTCSCGFSGFCGLITCNNEDLGSKIAIKTTRSSHVEALKRVPGVDVVALVDIVDPAQKAEELDVPNGFSDYREMIEAVKPDCIHICTPNHTHKEIALYAFEHGIHVICEKPMARNAEQRKCWKRQGNVILSTGLIYITGSIPPTISCAI